MKFIYEWVKRNQGPLARYLVSWLGVWLVSNGWADERVLPFLQSPEVQTLVGGGLVAGTLAAWQFAQRKGWTT